MLTLFGRELLTHQDALPRLPTEPSPADADSTVNPGQSSVGLISSVALHIAAIAIVLYAQQAGPLHTPRPVTRLPSRLVSVVYLPSIPLELPKLPTLAASPAKVEIRTEEPRPELPKPLPPRAFENRVAAVAPPPESRPVEAAPKPAPPKAAPRLRLGPTSIVRCLVFDVAPRGDSRDGFTGRIWVEERDFNIVRFNSITRSLSGSGKLWFNVDSWRTNVKPGLWLPSYVYSEQQSDEGPKIKSQMRVWGYDLKSVRPTQEFTTITIDDTSSRTSCSAIA